MEFTLKVKIDTQDEELAYNELRQSLQFCGLDIEIQGSWLKNNRPMPEEAAELCAAKWLSTHDPLSIDRRICAPFIRERRYIAFLEKALKGVEQ